MKTHAVKILQISYYPIRQAVTGGQRRVANFRGMLGELGHHVTTVAISPHRLDVEAHDILLDARQNNWVFRIPSHFELRLAQAVSLSATMKSRIARIFDHVKPDLLWLEHPFLWKVLEPFVTPRAIPVVYSSHNVEWKMNRELLAAKKICDPLEVYDIKLVEESLARRAAAIVCCSQTDAHYYRKLSTRRVSVIPNGADVPSVREADRAFYTVRFFCNDAFVAPTFCYVSSDHQPNWQGLADLVLDSMVARYPAKSVVILLIGRIGHLFRSWVADRSFPWWWLKIVPIMDASEDVKNLSLLLSDAILLPIVSGGGTNLKTAEALLAGRRIIATSTAFRGFEDYMANGDVSIADRPEDFRDAMDRVIDAPRHDRTSIYANNLMSLNRQPAFQRIRDQVSWKAIRREAIPHLSQCLEALKS